MHVKLARFEGLKTFDLSPLVHSMLEFPDKAGIISYPPTFRGCGSLLFNMWILPLM